MYLLDAFHVLGTVLGTGNTARNQIKGPACRTQHYLLKEMENENM